MSEQQSLLDRREHAHGDAAQKHVGSDLVAEQRDASAASAAGPHPALALLFLAYSLARSGIGMYVGNQDLQIPLIHVLRHPDAYPGDPFARSLPQYASPFWSFVAHLPASIPIPVVLVTGLLASRLLVILAAGRLARAVAPTSQLAPLAAWAFFALGPTPPIASGTLILDFFEHTAVALAAIMMAAALLLEKRPAWAGVLLGLAFACNFFYAAYAAAFLGVVCLLRSDIPNRARLAIAAAPFAAPVLVWALRASADGAADKALWIKAILVYYPYHFDPRTWPLGAVARFTAFVVVGAAAIVWERRRWPQAMAVTGAWIVLLCGFIAIALVSVTLLPSPQIMVVQPARAVDVFTCLFAVPAIALLAAQIEASRAQGAAPWIAGGVIGLLCALWYPSFVQGIGLVAGWALLGGLVVRRRSWVPSSVARGVIPVGVAALIGLFAAYSTLKRVHERGGHLSAMVRLPSDASVATAEWARDHSPPGSVFVVPPAWGAFRAISERSPFFTWKEGAAALWQRSYIDTWVDRLAALGIDVRTRDVRFEDLFDTLDHTYAALDDAHLCTIARGYKVDYWAAPATTPSRLPVVFSSGGVALRAVSVEGACAPEDPAGPLAREVPPVVAPGMGFDAR